MDTDQLKVWSAVSGEPASYYVNASESERKQFRDWLVSHLKYGEVTVDFVKADGDFRSMKCTLNESLGAKYTVNENRTARKSNPEVCVVWDTAQAAWRSFRWDRVKRIQFDLG